MVKQVIVIGLGQFGMGLIRSLAAKQIEVIAVDKDPKKVQVAATYATQALSFDATDSEALSQLTPRMRDVCVCATGDQSRESAIICTALLKQLGAKRIIARANDDLHARILRLIGADEVVNPEWVFGERFANHVLYSGIIEEMSLGTDLVITEFKVPDKFVGKNLIDLDLRRQHGIIVVAVRTGEEGVVKLPDPEDLLYSDDILVVVSKSGAVPKLLTILGESKGS